MNNRRQKEGGEAHGRPRPKQQPKKQLGIGAQAGDEFEQILKPKQRPQPSRGRSHNRGRSQVGAEAEQNDHEKQMLK